MAAERLYLDDSAALTFTATVTDVREFARQDGVQVWQLALDRTAFYPTGGGQPYDLGLLHARSRSGAELDVPIYDVVEDETGEVWHVTTKPLLPGTGITGAVDADRRLDHRQQHSAQHLLSAVLADQFSTPTIGFHLGETDTTIDLGLEDKAAQLALVEQLPEVEQLVNRYIASDLAVTARTVSDEEAHALLTAGRLRKLPPRQGSFRLIEIPGLDLNACGGTHVSSLGQIGCVLLRGTERVRKHLRLHFVAGLRAVRAARNDFSTLSELAAEMSTASDQLHPAMARLQTETKALRKERSLLYERLASLDAVQLAIEERIENGMRLVVRRYPDRDLDYLKLLAERLLDAVPQTVALLASTVQEPATVLLASNFNLPDGCNGLLKQAVAPWELRAGGTTARAQAQVPAALLDALTNELTRRLVGMRDEEK